MTLPWYILLPLHLFIAFGFCRWLMKSIQHQPSRVKKLFLQFLFCALIANIFAFSLGTREINRTAFLIVGLGFLNGYAAFCQWQAIKISLSKQSVFTFGDDIVAMLLGYSILNEKSYLTSNLLFGIILCLGAAILFAVHAQRKDQDGKKGFAVAAFFSYVLVYSVIWGVTDFFRRYFSISHVPAIEFVANWYVGATLMALVILLFVSRIDQEENRPFTIKTGMSVLPLSIGILLAFMTGYWSLSVTPLIVFQPIVLVAEMVIPTAIGLYVFHEHQKLDRQEKIYFLLGLSGGIIVAFNF